MLARQIDRSTSPRPGVRAATPRRQRRRRRTEPTGQPRFRSSSPCRVARADEVPTRVRHGITPSTRTIRPAVRIWCQCAPNRDADPHWAPPDWHCPVERRLVHLHELPAQGGGEPGHLDAARRPLQFLGLCGRRRPALTWPGRSAKTHTRRKTGPQSQRDSRESAGLPNGATHDLLDWVPPGSRVQSFFLDATGAIRAWVARSHAVAGVLVALVGVLLPSGAETAAAAAPRVQLSATRGAGGTTIVVRGYHLAPRSRVQIEWDGSFKRLPTTWADRTGYFKVSIRIPTEWRVPTRSACIA